MMCGRYYIDNKAIQYAKSLSQDNQYNDIQEKDIYPGDEIPTLFCDEQGMKLYPFKWGYSIFDNKKMINARAETLLEKRMFKDDAFSHRCLIPAKGFYEWNQQKQQYAFESRKKETLMLAGIYRPLTKEVVIVTTKANDSISPVHSRMPLLIPIEDVHRWLDDEHYLDYFLTLTPAELKRNKVEHD